MIKKISLSLYLFVAIAQFTLGQTHTCTDIVFPTVDNSLYQGVFYSDLKWSKNVITVSFVNGSDLQRGKVEQYAPSWSEHCGITFEFVSSADADIRVGFYQNKGSWSLIGRQSSDFSVNPNTGESFPGKSGISMNFGWFDKNTTDEEFRRTITHEFGHALGLLHEHMHPNSGIDWNYPRVYAHYLQVQNWSKDQVDKNVFQKYSVSQTNGVYDGLSIMHYPIPKEFTLNGYEVGLNTRLSEGDKNVIASLYPKDYEPTENESLPPHRITDLYYGDGVWALTMSAQEYYDQEAWSTTASFPEEEIAAYWEEGYRISNLSYGDGKWALVMKKGTDFIDQVWRTTYDFPEEEIRELYDLGYSISILTYGDGLWTLVMSMTEYASDQVWVTTELLPEDEIQEYWDLGYRITGMEYCYDRWVLVMDMYSGLTAQEWRIREHFPKDEIEELWELGYYITKLTYGDGVWCLIMSQGTNFYDQSWRTRVEFPEAEIRELWND